MPQENIKQIVRISDSDLDGSKPLNSALKKIRGISFMFSNAICSAANIDKQKKISDLTSEEIKKISLIMKNPSKFDIPSFLLNRQKDSETNNNIHITSTDLKFRTDNDIKFVRKIKSYKGMRHSFGLPVRGQRTRGNFRHGKTIGVRKKGLKTQQKPKTESKGKK